MPRRIGEGGFGVVYKCKYKDSPCVAKQIAPAKLAPKDLPLLQNEMCLWAQLDHRNCVKFYGVAFEPTDFYYLLCEYMTGGSLFDRHVKNRATKSKRTQPQMQQLLPEMRQVADAMEHLHSKHIVHRDLKSANVLIASDGRLCVADFGLVRYVAPEKETNMTAETGSYRWMAPEVIRHEPYGKGCDVYSYAILCWEMLTNSIPFPHHTPVEVALSVATKGLRPDLPSFTPKVLAELVQRCWSQDASVRPAFKEICSRIDAIEAAEALRELPSAAPAAAPAADDDRRKDAVVVPAGVDISLSSEREDGAVVLFGTRQQSSPSRESASSEHSGGSSRHRSPGNSLSGDKRKHQDQRSVISVDTSVVSVDTSPPADEAYPVATTAVTNDAELESAMKRPKSVDSNLSSAADRALNMCNRPI